MATTDKKRDLLKENGIGVFKDVTEFQSNYPPKKTFLTDALSETKDFRNRALDNAHKALLDAFGPKLDQKLKETLEAPQQSVQSDSTIALTMDDLEKMLLDLGMELADDDMVKECRKRLEECKDPSLSISDKDRMYKDIHRKFWAYVQSLPNKSLDPISTPSGTDAAIKKFMSGTWIGGIRYISHEGSTIVSALIGVSDDGCATVNTSQLPDEDKQIIQEVTKLNFSINVIPGMFFVRFDEYKNFEFSFEVFQKEGKRFTIGNRVASIPPHEAKMGMGSDVKIERKGKDILIGDRIKLERGRIQNLVQPTDPTNNGANRGGIQPRTKVSGRNAYEIRQDIIENAIEVIRLSNISKGKDCNTITDDVLDVAERLYDFVEHKKNL